MISGFGTPNRDSEFTYPADLREDVLRVCPDYGFGKRQPGGWHYSLLAFVELEDLRQMGTGGDRAAGKRTAF